MCKKAHYRKPSLESQPTSRHRVQRNDRIDFKVYDFCEYPSCRMQTIKSFPIACLSFPSTKSMSCTDCPASLTKTERNVVHGCTVPVAIHLILQLGYFKAKRRFFDYDHDAVRDDLHYIMGR